jgi:hypothetical protein
MGCACACKTLGYVRLRGGEGGLQLTRHFRVPRVENRRRTGDYKALRMAANFVITWR